MCKNKKENISVRRNNMKSIIELAGSIIALLDFVIYHYRASRPAKQPCREGQTFHFDQSHCSKFMATPTLEFSIYF